MDQRIRHHAIPIAGINTFYREAGAPDAPAILLPHGYPCSSFVHGRPWFAKPSLLDDATVGIAPVHSDLLCNTRCTVPDG
ncbi:hypothetical protein CAL20_18535 [Bordetella genomosp. 4]|uniref:Alpha/beta hydrolase n=1 Tax=Bordetella genomosp. 4 TaxID=463044 RepID=A0A261TYW8_9BORD|nr:hypothetical protein [Bordetella genomosp. 4]OZI45989.1 hypothetical protein CAL21_14825 [Bordetella genomosp. 4]OZI54467.1 hypothetical protein CAL20_18535 [Bordetella genomosp. 4]